MQTPSGEFSGQGHEWILESTLLTKNKGSCQGWKVGHVLHGWQEWVQLCAFCFWELPRLWQVRAKQHIYWERSKHPQWIQQPVTEGEQDLHRGQDKSSTDRNVVHLHPAIVSRLKIKTKQNDTMAVGTPVMTALDSSPRVTWSYLDWLISNLDTQLAHWDFHHPGDSPHFSPVTGLPCLRS